MESVTNTFFLWLTVCVFQYMEYCHRVAVLLTHKVVEYTLEKLKGPTRDDSVRCTIGQARGHAFTHRAFPHPHRHAPSFRRVQTLQISPRPLYHLPPATSNPVPR